MYDLIIRNGLLVDGTGRPGFRADLGVVGDKIVRIGQIDEETASSRVIDASGLVVAPGFIDIHSHSDRAVWVDPEAHSKVRQGVTTEVVGNCGSSAVPSVLDDELGGKWPSFEAYFDSLESRGIAVNIAALVGHSSVRAAAMGFERRPPTAQEMALMRRYVSEALEQGAVGFSSGLIYTPSSFAEPSEVVELCREAAKHNGIYATHLRGEGDTLLDAVAEAIDTAQKAGVPLQISHHKAMGKQNWGKVARTLEMMARANEAGTDITVDVYGYIAGSTNMNSLLPPWMHDGGKSAMLNRLKDPACRELLRTQMTEGLPGWSGRLKGTGWENIMIVSYPPDPSLEGKRVAKIADEMGKDPYDAAFDMLIEAEGDVPMCIFAMCEEDVETVLKSALSMVGSDGSSLRPEGPLGKGKPHPRNYGNFPRILGEYVRRRKVIDLPTAIYKMTAMPAAKLGLVGRGEIREGNFADIVVFDPDTITDTATFTNPHQYPLGIAHVFVNGVEVVYGNRHTGALPGRVLKRGRDTSR